MFPANLLDDVVVIGAGLAGTAFALSLSLSHEQTQRTHSNKPAPRIRIYESRTLTSPEISSGVILTPNGLYVLEKLGVLEQIKDVCWRAYYRTYKNGQDQTTNKTLIAGEELYGFANHRVWRGLLLRVMRRMLEERGVQIFYEKRYGGIIDEFEDGPVRFLINDQEKTATLLVGADGVYSSVRKYLDPIVRPEYTGVTAVISHINRSTVDWPYPDYEKSCTIQDKPGALIFIPENADGSEIMVGIQAQIPDRSRAEWDAMQADKDQLCHFYNRNRSEWGKTGQSIIDSVCRAKDMLYMWPFLRMPRLDTWFSPKTGRVVIIGDAAHAVPPSSGQGVNQALEDVWSLTLLLSSSIANPERTLKDRLEFWQKMRQERIDAVYDWATNTVNVQRLPEADRKKLIEKGKLTGAGAKENFDDMRWLYSHRADALIGAWFSVT